MSRGSGIHTYSGNQGSHPRNQLALGVDPTSSVENDNHVRNAVLTKWFIDFH